jgi:hypothetical protein
MTEHTNNSRAESFSARFFLALFLLVLAACGAREPSLSYKDGAIVAEGWSGQMPKEGWEGVLTVRAGEDASAPAMLGDYESAGGKLIFKPRFAPQPGVQLHASFTARPGAEPLTASFGEPAKALAATTRVTHIYPTTDEWPANTLKMYVEFSGPMARGEAYAHVRILDDKGVVIEGPFVEISEELWDPRATRVTLLFDPARIKRGLVDNETSGPPLMPGRTVTIEIDPTWRDASGAALVEKVTKTIRATDALRKAIDVKLWRVAPPMAPGDPLVVGFDRPLDHALASRAISVVKNGSPVAGEISLEKNESELRFTPSEPWKPGAYTIRVDGVLEDLAGNRPGKLFDVDTSDRSQSTHATPVSELTFTVR